MEYLKIKKSFDGVTIFSDTFSEQLYTTDEKQRNIFVNWYSDL